jgi:hypothetical protein
MGTGFLALFNKTERIEYDEGYWVEFSPSLTAAEYETAQRVLLGNMRMTGSQLSATPDTIAYQHELVFQAITAWNLTDEDNNPLPLEPVKAKHESIRKLPQSVFLDLYTKINAASSPRSGEEEIRFRADGESSDAGEEHLGDVPVLAEVSD